MRVARYKTVSVQWQSGIFSLVPKSSKDVLHFAVRKVYRNVLTSLVSTDIMEIHQNHFVTFQVGSIKEVLDMLQSTVVYPYP